jgi:hypothetical protein
MKSKQLLVLALSLSFASVYAQTEEQVLNSDPINVDGYLAEERPVSDSELTSLENTANKYKVENKLYKAKTKALNKVTNEAEKIGENAEEKIHAQVEAKRAENKAMDKIKRAETKLKCLMENSDSEDCAQFVDRTETQEVKIQQAAPTVSTTEVASSSGGGSFEKIKLLPYAGSTTYNGKVEHLEAEVAAGLRLESNINERFSMGIGFGYAQLKTNDFGNGLNYMNSGYLGAYGSQGREIQFRNMGLDLYGKFFITNGERFRPYIGAGLGYNRANMKYSENNPFISSSVGVFGNEDYQTSYASGNVMLGSEIMITRKVGLNLEAAYSTGLSNSLSSQNGKNPFSSPDQRRLQQLGDEIINANALSIFAGMVIVF